MTQVRETERQRQQIVAEATADEWPYEAWSNPVSAMLGTYILGVLLYMAGVSPWWPLLAGLAVTVTWVSCTVYLGTKDLGVAYTAAVSLSVTGWLTWAAGHPTLDIRNWPVTRDSWWILGTATAVLAVVWIVLIRQRANAEAVVSEYLRRRTISGGMYEEACRQAGIEQWCYDSEVETPGGRDVTMEILHGGTPYDDALNSLRRLEVNLRARYTGAVKLELIDPTHVVIHQSWENMLEPTIPLPPDTGPLDILQPMDVGRHEDGTAALRLFTQRSELTIGQRGGGKSNYMNIELARLARTTNVLIWMVCFKEGATLRPWLAPYAAGQAARPVIDWAGTSQADLIEMLRALDRIGKARAGRRFDDNIVPTPVTPAIVLFVDEAPDVLSNLNSPVRELLVHVIRKHRSEALDLRLYTQRNTMSMLGAKARDLSSQMGIINVFKVDNPGEMFNSLGVNKAATGGIDPSKFVDAGTMLTIAPDCRPMPTKVYRVENAQIPALAAMAASYRPQLEEVDAQAAGPAYARRWQGTDIRAQLLAAARMVGGEFQPSHVPAMGHAQVTSASAAEPSPEGRPALRVVPQVPHLDLTSSEPIATQLGMPDIRKILIRQHGAVEGERLYDRQQGILLLQAMRKILGAAPDRALPTRELLDHLALTAKWQTLTPERLAELVRPHGVTPGQMGAGRWGSNARGYRLAHVEEALQRPAEDSPAPA
jgi:hypothetical protein